MEKKADAKNDNSIELIDIDKEIDKLTEEVKALKNKDKHNQIKKKDKLSTNSCEEQLEINPTINYISEMLKTSSDNIITEFKAEFFRLFNFLSSLQNITPYPRKNSGQNIEEAILEREIIEENIANMQETIQQEKEMLKLLLEERESLIYELSDQIVAIETEKKQFKTLYEQTLEEKASWIKQKEVLEKLVTSDPRFNIINLLRRMGVIAPIQLSFVLGVSLSLTKQYISELEQMKIVQINEDDTISLHSEFDENTMNIRIETNENKNK